MRTKIRERRATVENLVLRINNTLESIAYCKRDTHGNSYYTYMLWPDEIKIVFILVVAVVIALMLGAVVAGKLTSSLLLVLILLAVIAVLYRFPFYRKRHLVHWNTEKTIARLREDAQRLEDELERLRRERWAETEKQFFVHNYNRYVKRKNEIQDEVAIYKPQFEALYDVIRTELGGEIYPLLVTYEDGREFESDIETRVVLPVVDNVGLNIQNYEFTKHDLDELVIKIIKLRPVIRERKQLLKEVGIPTT